MPMLLETLLELGQLEVPGVMYQVFTSLVFGGRHTAYTRQLGAET